METTSLEYPERKPYEAPAVTYETQLEVRAGTPVRVDPLDLLGTGE
jgi:hypothetical protein